MSTANGGLDSTNLKATFKVQPEHVQVEQVVIGKQESTRQRIDCFADAFAKAGASANYSSTTSKISDPSLSVGSKWLAVAGRGLRYYQPYDCTLALWQWSMFFHPARLSALLQDSGTIYRDVIKSIEQEVGIGLAVKLDGTILDHTRRQVPVQWVARDKTSTGGNHKGFLVSAYGGRTAQWWDMSHLATSVTRGYHDIQVVIYMERFSRDEATITYTPVRNGESLTDAATIRLMGRCAFGVGNVRVLSIL